MSNTKKIIIFFFIVAIILAMVPIIGNTLVKDTIESKLKILESKGLEVVVSDENVGYLETSRHYEFLVENSTRFLSYLETYSDEQLPPYTEALIGGTKVGIDLTYSNIPFSKAISLDVYPLSLPDTTMKDLESKDAAFSAYIEKFLFRKGLLYHIDYELMSKDFKGYIKDVNENYTMQNNAKIILKLTNTTFYGNGDLIAPSSLHMHSKKLVVKFLNKDEEMSINIDDLASSSTFENQTTYVSSSTLDTLHINLKQRNGEEESIDISKIYINISSNTQNEKAEINTKLSFEEMQTYFNTSEINASRFNYDFSVSNMDKKSFDALRVAISKVKHTNTNDLNAEIKDEMIRLLSKGIKVNISDLSIKNMNINTQDIKGFSISSEINLKEDSNLATKMMFSPLLILGNVEFDFKSKISKNILDVIISSSPVLGMLTPHIKVNKDEVELDILYKKGSLKVNGKTVLGR